MAVEKMEMLNLVAPMEILNEICKDVVLLENIHIVNALNEINESNFTLCVLEDNVDELVDMCMIKAHKSDFQYRDVEEKVKRLMEIFQIKEIITNEHLDGEYDFQQSIETINNIYKEVNEVYSDKEKLEGELKNLNDSSNHIKHIYKTDIDISCLDNLNFFNYKIGILSKENRIKLKKNYENISAIVFHIGSDATGEVYLIVSPSSLDTETNRILRSLNFHELKLPKEYSGTPEEIIRRINNRINEITTQIEEINKKIIIYKEKYIKKIEETYSRLKLEEKINKVKNETAYTNNFFYLAGWVSLRDKKIIESRFTAYGREVIIMFKDAQEVYKYMIPPTKLKNNILTRPFEALVKMYGTPSYDELDPTMFLGITYMLLFGAMFGDVGQGLVLLLAGVFLSKKEDMRTYGGILMRLGLSSTVFGFLYGSIFGFEHIVPALLIHPIENIDSMLMGSVVVGVIFLIISFAYSIVNHLSLGNIQDGIFGRNGVAGLVFYVSLLTLVLNKFMGINPVSDMTLYILISTTIVLMVIREPLANYIQGKRPLYHEAPSTYYIESGFDIFETFLNTLSNTISFIRVGAFALNHVGLFIAFQTMARLADNFAGSIIIYIIGNLIVIFLEGLIVLIQGLRLEYYELFSKYYRGEGVEFKPVKINN